MFWYIDEFDYYMAAAPAVWGTKKAQHKWSKSKSLLD